MIFLKKGLFIFLAVSGFLTAGDHAHHLLKSVANSIRASHDLPLHAAVHDNRFADVLWLVAHGVSVNHHSSDNVTPLHIAAATGNDRMLDLLLFLGAQVNARTCQFASPLHLAVGFQHYEAADHLLCNGAHPNAWLKGYISLHFAVLNDDIPMARLLLSHGAPPCVHWRNDSYPRHRPSPLEIAYQQNNHEMIRILQAEADQYRHMHFAQRNPRTCLTHEFVRTLSVLRMLTDDEECEDSVQALYDYLCQENCLLQK